jgi:hypothetical protein
MRHVYRKLGLAQLKPQKSLAPPDPKSKMLDPSTENGRRSSKKVSTSLRFTTAGSTSTWPKSGFTVPASVRLPSSPTLKSAPAPAP